MLNKQINMLYKLANGREPSFAIMNRIEEIIEENDLNTDEEVPIWLTEFLSCLIEGRTKERSFYLNDTSKGDTSNFRSPDLTGQSTDT